MYLTVKINGLSFGVVAPIGAVLYTTKTSVNEKGDREARILFALAQGSETASQTIKRVVRDYRNASCMWFAVDSTIGNEVVINNSDQLFAEYVFVRNKDGQWEVKDGASNDFFARMVKLQASPGSAERFTFKTFEEWLKHVDTRKSVDELETKHAGGDTVSGKSVDIAL